MVVDSNIFFRQLHNHCPWGHKGNFLLFFIQQQNKWAIDIILGPGFPAGKAGNRDPLVSGPSNFIEWPKAWMRAHGHVGMFAVLVVYLDTVCHCVLISAPIVDAAAAGANTENKVLATPFRKVMFPLTDNDCTYVCIFHRAVGQLFLHAYRIASIALSLSLSLASHFLSSSFLLGLAVKQRISCDM